MDSAMGARIEEYPIVPIIPVPLDDGSLEGF